MEHFTKHLIVYIVEIYKIYEIVQKYFLRLAAYLEHICQHHIYPKDFGEVYHAIK